MVVVLKSHGNPEWLAYIVTDSGCHHQAVCESLFLTVLGKDGFESWECHSDYRRIWLQVSQLALINGHMAPEVRVCENKLLLVGFRVAGFYYHALHLHIRVGEEHRGAISQP
jgi:hypothetical protein